MTRQDVYERILSSLHDAMLDDSHWPATSALIDEVCGIAGNALLVGEGPQDDICVTFVGLYYHGQRRTDLEREYLELYHPIDERVPRVRQLPDSHVVPIRPPPTRNTCRTPCCVRSVRANSKPRRKTLRWPRNTPPLGVHRSAPRRRRARGCRRWTPSR